MKREGWKAIFRDVHDDDHHSDHTQALLDPVHLRDWCHEVSKEEGNSKQVCNEIICKMLSLLTGVFRIIIDNIENSPAALINPNPSAVGLAEDSLDREDQEDIAEEDELSSSMDERKPKFLNYWMTRTKTMTITSYSTTSTFGSLICTPTSFQYGPCPGSGWIGK